MTRPRKQTVDYYPHQCTHGKTIFILEQSYGNDGYAFWFKLLEMLGSTEGHCLTFHTPADWTYLQARTHIQEDTCRQILDLLATLSAIDPELWHENRVVWSDNFVEGITDAYRNRKAETPSKPDNLPQKPASSGITDARKPHTKLNETKLDEMKGKDPPPSSSQAPQKEGTRAKSKPCAWCANPTPEAETVQYAMQRFHDGYRKQVGVCFIGTKADFGKMKDFLTGLPSFEEAMMLIERWFGDWVPFAAETQYDLGAMKSQRNKLRAVHARKMTGTEFLKNYVREHEHDED